MDINLLYKVLNKVVEENNYGAYKINGMKLEKYDYSVNCDGKLEYNKYIDVIIETENGNRVKIMVKDV